MGIFSIFKKKAEIKRNIIKTYIIEFPYIGIIENELPKDDEYISGKEVYLYLGQENIDGINMSWNGSNMQDFIDDKKIKNKVVDMNLSLKNNGICYIYIRTYEELTKEDKEYLLNYVKGQASDGWGEGDFDYIYDKNTKEIYFYWDCQEKAREETCIPFAISFWWNSNDWYIRYVEDDK